MFNAEHVQSNDQKQISYLTHKAKLNQTLFI